MTTPEEPTFWETIGKTRWGTYINNIEREAILRAHRLARRPNVAFEVGCEGGRWSAMLAELGWTIVCTDVNPRSLEVAKARIPSAECILVSPSDEQIPASSQSVDLLLCIEVFEVVHQKWFRNEAIRVLRPGGICVGVITNSRSVRRLGYSLLSIFDSDRRSFGRDANLYSVNYRDWKQGLVDNGFSMEYEEGCCWLPFSRASNSFLIPWLTSVEKHFGLRRLPDFSPWVVFIVRRTS